MNKKDIFLILIVISLSLTITYICQKDALFNKYIANDDSNHYITPFYKIQDPALFQDDIFSEYSLNCNTIGIDVIYSIFSIFFDPLSFSKILPFILCSLSAIYFFLIGKKIHNKYCGFIAAAMFIMYSWTISACFSGGHARAFAFLLLSSFVYYMLEKKYFLSAVILLLQTFIYPPIGVISLLSVFILFLPRIIKNFNRKVVYNYEIKLTIFIIIINLLILSLISLQRDYNMGPLVSFKEMIRMPEFFRGGRTPFFIDSFKMLKDAAISDRVTGIPIYNFSIWFLLVISLEGIYLMIKKKIAIHPALNAVCISGIILYFLSWALLFKLYYPGRYLKFILPFYLIFLCASTITRTIIDRTNQKRLQRVFWVAFVIISLHVPFLNKDLVNYKNTRLYQFIATLPKNSLIAGHPFETSEIPLFSKRKVFIEFELSMPFYRNYYKQIKQRTYDFFRLYYSSSFNEIKEVCIEYGIDYILVRKGHFSRPYIEKYNFYIEPFNLQVRSIIENNFRNGFVLANIPAACKIYEDNDLFIVKVNGLKM
ncbi:MAG: hypothetical protein ABII75_06995 [Candidatus Omnitrophota bacterium]